MEHLQRCWTFLVFSGKDNEFAIVCANGHGVIANGKLLGEAQPPSCFVCTQPLGPKAAFVPFHGFKHATCEAPT